MPPPYRRALARALALTLTVATLTLAAPASPAQADDIPKAPAIAWSSGTGAPPPPPRPSRPGAPAPPPPRPQRAQRHARRRGGQRHPPYAGPLGRNPEVTSEKIAPIGGECATATFDAAGRLITVCGTFTGFLLKLLDPRTLDTLAEYKLPQRSSTVEAITRLDFARIFKDTSGGAYFYLDDRDRVVLADSRQHVLRIAHRQDAAGRWEFTVEDDWDLTGHVPHDCVSWTNLFPSGTCDPVTSVMPDWQGRIWWVTRLGRVGTVDPDTSAVRSVRLDGEEIQNSFSVDRDAVSIVSDHALYSFTAAPTAPRRSSGARPTTGGPAPNPARSTRARAPPPTCSAPARSTSRSPTTRTTG